MINLPPLGCIPGLLESANSIHLAIRCGLGSHEYGMGVTFIFLASKIMSFILAPRPFMLHCGLGTTIVGFI